MNPDLDNAWADEGLFPSTITRAWDETPTLRVFELDVSDTALADGYSTPGQYVTMSIAGLPGAFFAMAAGPDTQGNLLFLLRLRGPLGERLRRVGVGDQVGISAVDGPGFPVHKALGRDCLFFATGSGIAPIRALIEYVLARREDFGALTLYYGERSAEDVSFRGDLKAWEDAGVRVKLALSRASADEADGAFHGYVQESLSASPPPNPDSAVFLCGVDGMVKGVKQVLTSQGLDPSQIYMNY